MSSVQRTQEAAPVVAADTPTPEAPAPVAPARPTTQGRIADPRSARTIRAPRTVGTQGAMQPPAPRSARTRDAELEDIQNMHQHGKIQAAMCNGGYLPRSECE